MDYNFKTADQNSKDAVYGFVRRIANSKEMISTPELIKTLCLGYYFDLDRFDVDECRLTIFDDGFCIKKNPSDNSGYAYLTNMISSGVYYWKFKLADIYYSLIVIGIRKIDENNLINASQENWTYTSSNVNYCLEATSGTTYKSGINGRTNFRMSTTGSIITMILDLNQFTLSYEIRDRKKIAFNIENGKYIAVVGANGSVLVELKKSGYH
eukprot:169277_1